MWRWGLRSISQTVFWGCRCQSTKGSAQQKPKLRHLEDATSAAFPATASPGARRRWWGLTNFFDLYVLPLYSPWNNKMTYKDHQNAFSVNIFHFIWLIKAGFKTAIIHYFSCWVWIPAISPSVRAALWRLRCPSLQFDLTKREPEPPAPTMGPGILEAGGDFNPPESPPSRDFYPDYIITVIVPLVLAIVLCLMLAYIMFGRREGVYVSVYSKLSTAELRSRKDNSIIFHLLLLSFYVGAQKELICLWMLKFVTIFVNWSMSCLSFYLLPMVLWH